MSPISSKHIKHFIFTAGLLLMIGSTNILQQPVDILNNEIIARQTWLTLIGAGLVATSSVSFQKKWYFVFGSFSAILGALLMNIEHSAYGISEIQRLLITLSHIFIISGLALTPAPSTKKTREQPNKKDP